MSCECYHDFALQVKYKISLDCVYSVFRKYKYAWKGHLNRDMGAFKKKKFNESAPGLLFFFSL